MANQKNTSLNRAAKIKEILITILLYAILIFLSIIVLLPIIWIIGSSFNPGATLSSATMIPENPTLRHYIRLFTETDYLEWYWNTFRIAVIHTILSIFLSTSMGYVFSRFVFKGKKIALITMLVLQMFPMFMAMAASNSPTISISRT